MTAREPPSTAKKNQINFNGMKYKKIYKFIIRNGTIVQSRVDDTCTYGKAETDASKTIEELSRHYGVDNRVIGGVI